MVSQANVKTLLKILIGVAWIDGKIQPEERRHLDRIAAEQELAQDPEIKPLLGGLVSVTSEQCYGWIQQYLGSHPTGESCQKLVEAISALVYSDGEVAIEEAKLLNRVQQLADAHSNSETPSKAVLGMVRQLYRDLVGQAR
ncbi:MAG: TerB family tellurite resistance protein [Leptolyngbyaceae cyanobacterium SM1_1_3]|nr:TerB family tellurite resistance protein [Leptolyngbyaceae cyanobacterium SM1_1_3]NJN01240.1 TerB family tellurite resistance protein [Leptolyngbyaceae cyanobacterium RM1_1_2]NJO11675.1 TerB family tellurite resistance protein [Leptolyngbyaceae cyanobacterium SL_1_1]